MYVNLQHLLVSGAILLVTDFVYLSSIQTYFSNVINKIQGSPLKIDLVGTFVCYVLLIFGLNYFILSSRRSAFDAFLLGLIIYGVFETTNKSLFSKWDWKTVFIDTLWGGILFVITTYLFYKIN